ncbi:hypothetical protein LCGC14_1118570, partial [marine sediment metagenome]
MGILGVKTCLKCEETKPFNEFSKHKGRKYDLQDYCKLCKRDYDVKWKKEHQESRRDSLLKYDHGITLKIYNQILKAQNYKCAICGRHEEKFKKHLHVDHDHITGKVRGILCP